LLLPSGAGSAFGVTPSMYLWPSGITMTRWKVILVPSPPLDSFAAAIVAGSWSQTAGNSLSPSPLYVLEPRYAHCTQLRTGIVCVASSLSSLLGRRQQLPARRHYEIGEPRGNLWHKAQHDNREYHQDDKRHDAPDHVA
jgi:hypothetical protein